MSRTILRAAALSAATLLLLTGCSSDDDTEAAAEATAAVDDVAADRALSADELEKALLTVDEMPTGYAEEPAGSEGDVGDEGDITYRSDDAECQALLDKFGAFEDKTEDAASAVASFGNEGAGTYVDLTVESYEGDEASEGIAAMKAAYETCGSWTEVDADGMELAVTASTMSFPQVGDESYASQLVIEVEDMPLAVNLVVSRVGKSVSVVAHTGVFEVDVAETEKIVRASVEKLEKASV